MKQRILFAVIMALFNASIISFILTAYNIGFPENFISRWLVNFTIAFLIVVPSILFLAPIAGKLSHRIAEKK
jgi:hypothetical protein